MCLILFLVWEKFDTCAEFCHKVIKQETDRDEYLCEPGFWSATFMFLIGNYVCRKASFFPEFEFNLENVKCFLGWKLLNLVHAFKMKQQP